MTSQSTNYVVEPLPARAGCISKTQKLFQGETAVALLYVWARHIEFVALPVSWESAEVPHPPGEYPPATKDLLHPEGQLAGMQAAARVKLQVYSVVYWFYIARRLPPF